MCGTPLLRVGNVLDASVKPKGDVLSFFLWQDIAQDDQQWMYYNSQPCDPIIDGRWDLAKVDSRPKSNLQKQDPDIIGERMHNTVKDASISFSVSRDHRHYSFGATSSRMQCITIITQAKESTLRQLRRQRQRGSICYFLHSLLNVKTKKWENLKGSESLGVRVDGGESSGTFEQNDLDGFAFVTTWEGLVLHFLSTSCKNINNSIFECLK
jgi:hypothetical protein